MSNKRVFSHSRLLDYATCPRKYYWHNIVRITPKIKAKALSFGYCMSEALRALRKMGSVKDAEEAFVKAWIEDGQVLKRDTDPDDPKDFRTVARGFQLIAAYAETYPDEPQQIIKSEVKFDDIHVGDIDDLQIYIRGRIDGVVLTSPDISIIEDKTTSRLGPGYFKDLRGSLQVGIYLWVADKLGLFQLRDKPVTPRCILNAMRVHPTEFKFDRDIILIARPKLDLVKQNFLNWIAKVIEAEKTENFPLNDIDGSVCGRFGGCEYLPLKYARGRVLDSLLEREYIKKEEK